MRSVIQVEMNIEKQIRLPPLQWLFLLLVAMSFLGCGALKQKAYIKPIPKDQLNIIDCESYPGQIKAIEYSSGVNRITICAVPPVHEKAASGPIFLPIFPDKLYNTYEDKVIIDITVKPPPDNDYNINEASIYMNGKNLKPYHILSGQNDHKTRHILYFDFAKLDQGIFTFKVPKNGSSLEEIAVLFELSIKSNYEIDLTPALIQR